MTGSPPANRWRADRGKPFSAAPRLAGALRAAQQLAGTGTGGVTELRELLTQENIFFGLVRTIETIDKTEAVKFVFISFVGEKIGVMRKARISTLRGGIQAAFDPFHCELLNLSSNALSWFEGRKTR